MKYAKITDQTRKEFITKVQSGVCTIREAAKQFGIKFSTAKAILSIYKHEGRIGKKQRRIRRESKDKPMPERETVKTLREENEKKEIQEVKFCQQGSSSLNMIQLQLYQYQQWYQASLLMQQLQNYQPLINYHLYQQ